MSFYRPGKTTRIVFLSISTIFILAGIWLILASLFPSIPGGEEGRGRWIGAVMGPLFIYQFSMTFLETLHGGIRILDYRIEMKRALNTRTLLFSEIKGFRTTDHGVMILESARRRKRIRISRYLEHFDELQRWLMNRFVNLDDAFQKDQEQNLRENTAFGTNAEDRVRNLGRAQKIARYLNWFEGAAAVWVIFEQKYLVPAFAAAISAPLLCLLAMLLNRGLLRLDQEHDSPYPNVLTGLMLSSCAIFLRSAHEYAVLDYAEAWKMTARVAGFLVVPVLLAGLTIPKPPRRHVANTIVAAVLFVLYCFATVTALNGLLDKSGASVYNSVVLDKRKPGGSFQSPKLVLAPWGSRGDTMSLDVKALVFGQVQVGNQVHVIQRQGWLKIPWCYIAR